MPRTSYADVNLDVDPEHPTRREPVDESPDRDTPFRILVIGDFSGRASRDVMVKGPRKAIAVDRDNFERVLNAMNVQLCIPVKDAPPLEVSFRELDDFHPDRLFQNHALFQKLREIRDGLDDPSQFKQIAALLGFETGAPKPAPAAEAAPAPPPARAMGSVLGGSLLDQALEATETRASSAPKQSTDPLSQYVRALVTPHLTPKPDPKRGEVAKQVDGAIGGVLRILLHNPAFQELESNWRALDLLIRELETGPRLKVYLLDISRDEMDVDLAGVDDLRRTAMFKLLVQETVQTPGAHPWAVIVGSLHFGPGMSDLNLLGRMGLLARMAGAPFLAGASAELLGCKSLAETPYPEDWKPGAEQEGWELIRSLPEARYLGLTLPRFMARRPYGKKSEATEAFEFEELDAKPKHEEYLWANSAFLCACLLGQAFSEYGWGMDPGAFLTIRGLPSHVYHQDGEAVLTPPGELTLTQTAMEKIMERGIMPLMSYANGDQVRLAGYRSVAAQLSALRGRWG